MKITFLTLFPEMYDSFLNTSIIKRAIAKKSVEVECVNIRDFTHDKHGRVDSTPIGGGAGLVMKCQPIVDALNSVKKEDSYVVLMSPTGKTFNQKIAHRYCHFSHLIIICGHYEGIDDRIKYYIDDSISIGDYILTGGELASQVIADAIIRLLDGAISEDSIIEETFENGLLEYPQYTEPYEFDGHLVPDILFSGNHQAISKWRQKESLRLTKLKRPDIFDQYPLTKSDIKLLHELESDTTPKWESDAISKGHKFMKTK